MRISELSRLTGVSVHALRHYESLGMLHPARRPNGYRDYPASMRREVVFIAMSRSIGIPLKTIAEHLPSYRARRLGTEDLIAAMRTRIEQIDGEIAALREQRRRVADHIRWVRDQARQAAGIREMREPGRGAPRNSRSRR